MFVCAADSFQFSVFSVQCLVFSLNLTPLPAVGHLRSESCYLNSAFYILHSTFVRVASHIHYESFFKSIRSIRRNQLCY